MYCQHCGSEIPEGANACEACGEGIQLGGTSKSSRRTWDFQETGRDALTVLKSLPYGPRASLDHYDEMGDRRGLATGAVLCVAFGVVATVAVQNIANSMFGLSAFGLRVAPNGGFFGLLVRLLTIPVALFAIVHGMRRVLGRSDLSSGASPGKDALIVGVALLPLALVVLLGALLGIYNAEVLLLGMLLVTVHFLATLYEGFERMGNLKPPALVPALAGSVALSAWLSKVLWTALS